MSKSSHPDDPAHKKIAFRVDASLHIGNGHVMRCLTLATALQEQGAECHFICREHPGNLVEQIRRCGFAVAVLPIGDPDFRPHSHDSESLQAHAVWLGTDWCKDAKMTYSVLRSVHPDWLVIDHYALGSAWEQAMRPHVDRLMVIDDLADRPHDCDLLLDQNLGRVTADYAGLVPARCTVLTGSHYALLRPEFAELRKYSLQRRKVPRLHQLLISMGGVDQLNATGQVLDTLRQCLLPEDCRIIVVMGLHAPWLHKVLTQANDMPWPCEVQVNVSDMAQLMADSDLAIGAAGGTAWERCALGLPTLIVTLARNQERGAIALGKARAAFVINGIGSIAEAVPKLLATISGAELTQMSDKSSILCDGRGTQRVVTSLVDYGCRVRPMEESDLVNVLRWRNHPDVRRFMYARHEISPAEHRAWYERTLKDRRRHLMIVEDESGSIGFAQFTEQEGRSADWGFYAAPDAPPRIGTKLGTAALNHAFHQLEFDKVCGEAIAFNERSIALHRKLGFRDEGVLLDHYFDGDRYHDVYRFGMLASDWDQQH